jgi:hypothetical protein
MLLKAPKQNPKAKASYCNCEDGIEAGTGGRGDVSCKVSKSNMIPI